MSSSHERHAMRVGDHLVRAEWSAEHGQLEITVEGVSAEPKVHVTKNRTRIRLEVGSPEPDDEPARDRFEVYERSAKRTRVVRFVPPGTNTADSEDPEHGR